MRRLGLIALLFAAAIARASDDTAVITIIVTAGSQSRLPGIVVSVDGVEKKTGADGSCRFVVKAGRHSLHTADGRSAWIDIAAGQTTRWTTNYCFAICDPITVTIPVEEIDDAPIDTPLTDQLRDLPLGRTIIDVARLAPGSQPEQFPGGFDALFVDGIPGDELHNGGPSLALPLDFFQAVNVISGAIPTEFGHASGTLILATPRHTASGIGLFAYAQPSTHDAHGGARFDHQQWDAGVTFGNRWLFAAYDHATSRDDLRFGDLESTARDGVDSFFVRGELHRRRLAIVGEVAGNPATTHFREGPLTSSYERGMIAESLEALALVHDTSIDGSFSHRDPRQQGNFFDASGDRVRIDVAREFGAHLLRAGAEREQLRESLHFFIAGESRSNTTAAYVTDMWQLGSRLTANAGVRAEAFHSDAAISTGITRSHFSDGVLSPRASLVWLWTPGIRIFGTYAKMVDDVPVASGGTYIMPPRHAAESTAGIERVDYRFGGGVRLIHRRNENGVLVTSNWSTGPGMVMRASYRYDYGNTHAFGDGDPYIRPHNVIGEWSQPFGRHFRGGTVVQWMSPVRVGAARLPSYFSADLHAGVSAGKAEFVVDIFNTFGNQSPVLDPDPPFGIPVSYLGTAWQRPRSVRFGIRAAL